MPVINIYSIFKSFSYLCDLCWYFPYFYEAQPTDSQVHWLNCLSAGRVTQDSLRWAHTGRKREFLLALICTELLECQTGAGCKMETSFHLKIGKIKLVTILHILTHTHSPHSGTPLPSDFSSGKLNREIVKLSKCI